jgi:hypothetical protein
MDCPLASFKTGGYLLLQPPFFPKRRIAFGYIYAIEILAHQIFGQSRRDTPGAIVLFEKAGGFLDPGLFRGQEASLARDQG